MPTNQVRAKAIAKALLARVEAYLEDKHEDRQIEQMEPEKFGRKKVLKFSHDPKIQKVQKLHDELKNMVKTIDADKSTNVDHWGKTLGKVMNAAETKTGSPSLDSGEGSLRNVAINTDMVLLEAERKDNDPRDSSGPTIVSDF